MKEIKINPEYETLLPSLSPEEFEALKDSIKQNGLFYPITLNENGVILDGHQRYKACLELSIGPQYETKEFDDKLSEKLFVIDANLERRQLTNVERAELGMIREPLEQERGKQRMSKAGKIGVDIREGRVVPNEPTLIMRGKASDITARKVGLSPTTYHRIKTVLEKGNDELKDRMRKGKTSPAYAYKTLRLKEKHANPPPLPQDEYDVILADPPWNYYLPLRGSPDMHYPTMTNQEIETLPIPSAPNSILFLWATNPKLEDALQVMKAWGFTYKTNMAWIKDKIGTGYYFRGQHELLLVGTKGTIPVPEPQNRPNSILKAPRMKHSKKPEDTYERIEIMYPNRQYLELFARTKRDGWKSWGLEIG